MKISLTKKPIKPMTTKPSAVLEVILVNSVLFEGQGTGVVVEEEDEVLSERARASGGALPARKKRKRSRDESRERERDQSRWASSAGEGVESSTVDLLRIS